MSWITAREFDMVFTTDTGDRAWAEIEADAVLNMQPSGEMNRLPCEDGYARDIWEVKTLCDMLPVSLPDRAGWDTRRN